MKTCEDYKELLSQYIDGELGDEETSGVFYHVGECLDCREFLSSMLKLRSAIQETNYRREERKSHAPIWERTIAVSYPVAAAIAVIAMLSGYFLFNRGTTQQAVIEKTTTEYVYLTSFPPVYAVLPNASNVTTN